MTHQPPGRLAKPRERRPREAEMRPYRPDPAQELRAEAEGVPRIRSHCRLRSRGTEYVSDSGMKRMSGSTKR
jgi:hypothetical protein